MKRLNEISGIIFLLFSILSLTGCGGGSGTPDNSPPDETIVTYDDIIHDLKIEFLKDELYYFPANTPNNEKVSTQPLKQFDFIFVGHDRGTAEEGQNVTDIIPGTYTHMLMYIGKDSDGLAYGIEMNVNADARLEMKEDGTIHIDGQLYLYCLGSDYTKECPKDEYVWGLETYDYLWAKRVTSSLHDSLTAHKDELMAQIKNDLIETFPFQLPINVDTSKYQIKLVNDGRINGADCTAYMTLLFEEVASVCMDDIHVDADAMRDYYINDPRGQAVYIPAEENPLSSDDLYISELLESNIFSIINNLPRETACPDEREAVGIPTPDKIFNSPSLVEIPQT